MMERIQIQEKSHRSRGRGMIRRQVRGQRRHRRQSHRFGVTRELQLALFHLQAQAPLHLRRRQLVRSHPLVQVPLHLRREQLVMILQAQG